MVFMGVGKQNRIQMFAICPKHLIPKIRGGVNNKRGVGRRDHDRASQPIIMRITGLANLAIATDHRYATTGAGAQEFNMKPGVTHRTNVTVNGNE